jgi:hypothetical protein
MAEDLSRLISRSRICLASLRFARVGLREIARIDHRELLAARDALAELNLEIDHPPSYSQQHFCCPRRIGFNHRR